MNDSKIEYYVEVNFANGKGWVRNDVGHPTIDSADLMAKFFIGKWETRIVQVETTTTIVKQSAAKQSSQ